MVSFCFKCNSDRNIATRRKFYYNRGRYDYLRMDIDWHDKLAQTDEVNLKWLSLRNELKKAELQFIPNKLLTPDCKHNRKGIHLDQKTFEATRKKHRSWERYMETRDPSKYKEYVKQRNKDRAMTRKLQKDLEKDIAIDIKNNTKRFWSFVKSKTKTRTGIADLVKSNGEDGELLTNSDSEKAQVLADFFSSVY